MSTKVTCETDLTSLLVIEQCQMFFMYFIVIQKNKDHIRQFVRSVLLLFRFAKI